jgi:hypothetical protein
MKTTGQDIPKQFSTLTELGEPIETFKAKASLTFQIIAAVILFLAFGGLLAYALYVLYDLWTSNYYFPVIIETMLPWLIGAAVSLLIGAIVLWQIFSSRKKGAVVYSQGFAYSDRKGVQVWKWENVQEVTANIVRNYTNGIYVGTTHTYTLVNTRGEKLVINDSLKDVENFYTHLQNNSLQLRYQSLADRYNQGQEVVFGPVSISKQNGLRINKKAYSWETIEQVSIEKGVLSVKKKDGGWFSGASATSGTIPNLHVLLSIIDQVIGLKAGR